MANFFLAGPELVRWDLEIVEATGFHRVRLSVHHMHGSIVEYFESTREALLREQELENLLIAARGFACAVPALATR